MRRADRLFRIVQHLRGRRLTTAAQLAKLLEVSERTVYRDMQDLSLSGVPIEAEAGVGYRLSRGFDLPPIMFTWEEVQALVAGARMIGSWSDKRLDAAARSALAKIESALPPERRGELARTRLYAPNFQRDTVPSDTLEVLRHAIDGRNKVRMSYEDANSRVSHRVIGPLGLYFWGRVWTLAAWCESREDFRSFRVDRCVDPAAMADIFAEEPGRTLEDYLRLVRERMARGEL